MKAFLLKLWNGEPVYLFGFINVVFVALSIQYQWAAVVALVTVPLSSWAVRNQVESPGENMFGS